MTREKEIEQAMKDTVAETIYASGWGMTPQATDLLECAFTNGAKWADKTMLDKAVKWLVMNASDYAISTTDDEDNCVVSLDMVEDFRKAMEE